MNAKVIIELNENGKRVFRVKSQEHKSITEAFDEVVDLSEKVKYDIENPSPHIKISSVSWLRISDEDCILLDSMMKELIKTINHES